jgi:type II secretory pathway component PulF
LGSGRKHLALARFSAALEALLSAGVPVIPAWSMAADASHSPAIHRGVQRIIPRVQAGETPAEAIRPLKVFPDMYKSLYTSGEISGQIDSTLQRLRNYHQEQGTMKLHNFGQWTPRIIFLIVAIAIAIQIVNFYTGYFNNAFQGF